ITGRTGGTATLSGQITDSNDAGGGISFTGNTGATAAVTNANNVVDTGAATAIDVENTTIGASGINFKTASSNGAANGIKLDTTGSTGGLNVTSTGSGTCTTAAAAGCTGGAIQNSTGPGVLLNSVGGPVSLTRVSVNGGGDDGIRANSVGTSAGSGIALANSVISGNGTVSASGNDENGLDYTNVVGTTSITSDVITGSNDFNAQIVNDSSGTLNLTVQSSTFSNAGVDDGLALTSGGSTTMNSTIGGVGVGNTFTNNKGDGIDFGSIAASPNAHSDTTIANNTVTGNASTATDGGIYWTPAGKAKAHLLNNNVQNVSATAMSVQSPGSADATATTDVTVENNVIGTNGQTDSGSVDGDGL